MRRSKEEKPGSEPRLDRRDLLKQVGGAGVAAWLSWDLLFADTPEQPGGAAARSATVLSTTVPSTTVPGTTAKGILRLRLRAQRLPAMADFYGGVLGFSTGFSGQRLVVQGGGTEIVFEPAETGEKPIYHLAWAIPENKLARAKAWLTRRTPLLVHTDGRDEFLFRHVNRSAVYFADPVGNVLELIARHNLRDGREGDFTTEDILYVNHAGLVVDDMSAAIEGLRAGLGLELRREPTPHFAQLGDEYRHLVLVTRKRLWLPEGKVPAEVFATDIVLHGEPASQLELKPYPYRVSLEGA